MPTLTQSQVEGALRVSLARATTGPVTPEQIVPNAMLYSGSLSLARDQVFAAVHEAGEALLGERLWHGYAPAARPVGPRELREIERFGPLATVMTRRFNDIAEGAAFDVLLGAFHDVLRGRPRFRHSIVPSIPSPGRLNVVLDRLEGLLRGKVLADEAYVLPAGIRGELVPDDAKTMNDFVTVIVDGVLQPKFGGEA